MVNFIIKFRWIIIVSCLLIGTGFATLIPLSKTDPDIRNYIPHGMSSRVATDKIEFEFGVQDMIVVLFTDSSILQPDNLNRIREIDKGISRLNGVSNRMSPFTMKSIKGEEGMMIADPLLKEIPANDEEIQRLEESILENRFARDIVFSSDMTTASVTATIGTTEIEDVTLNKVDSVIGSHPGEAKILKGGLPYIRHYLMKDVRRDGYTLVPAALLIMLLILKFTLGDWRSVIMPFMVVVLSTSISMGLVPLFGWKFSIITLLVPIIIVAVANNYGIYLVARHQEISQDWKGSNESILQTLYRSLNMPILFSGLTTIAGILGLLTHSIIPAKQVGILAATGVTIALIMSLTFIPALIYFRHTGYRKLKQERVKKRAFDKILGILSGIIVKNPGRILIFSAILTVVISLGIIFLRIDTNQENYFPQNHPIRSASNIINNKLGGSQTISVMVNGDIKDPVVMKRIDSLSLQIEKVKGVGKVFSISQVVREMSKAIFLKDEIEYDKVPDTRNAIAQMFELYNMSGDANDFKQLLSPDNTKAHILIRLSKPDNSVIYNVRERITELTAGFPAEITIGGYAIIMADFAGSIIKGQVLSLIFAVITVFLLLAIIFKSVQGGLTGSIPLIASIFILFGFMGITGIALDAATALLSSIMIGVGVDFTIQFMWCFNIELRKGLTHEEAAANTLATIGRSIIINALSVMAGFSALMLSGFTSIRFFGYMVVISIGSCLIGAIIIIPAYLIVFKPRFISMDLNNRKNRKNEKRNNLVTADSAAFTGSSATA
jgi:predicted RND superfamily exporter protein